ncbi:hypothetical protein GOD54_23575 [Sinorhizobium medicae]|nr:hypothetical protein [Sinorhizobium medicae]
MAKVDFKAERLVLEKKGRLTTGDAPLHVRRAALANPIADCAQMIQVMLDNWPAEFMAAPADPVRLLLIQMDKVAKDLTTAPPSEDWDDEDLI